MPLSQLGLTSCLQYTEDSPVLLDSMSGRPSDSLVVQQALERLRAVGILAVSSSCVQIHQTH